MSAEDTCKYYSFAVKMVKEAGNMILERDFKKDEIKSKKINDFVTEIDVRVEKFCRGELESAFPCHKFIGEESVGPDGKVTFTDDFTWVIDPVDGTTNFIHNFPHSCISLALFHQKEPIVGIIYNPSLNQLFSAQKGNGAFLNEKRIHVSDCKNLQDSLFLSAVNAISLENITKLVDAVHGIRNLGSAALNMCMVALGGADAYLEFGIHIWDFGAGAIIVREAGGVAVDPTGGPLNFLSRRLLAASSQELAQQVAGKISQVYPPSD